MKPFNLSINELAILIQAHAATLGKCTHDSAGNLAAFRLHKNLVVLSPLMDEARRAFAERLNGDADADAKEKIAQEVGSQTVEVNILPLPRYGILWAELDPAAAQELIRRDLAEEKEVGK